MATIHQSFYSCMLPFLGSVLKENSGESMGTIKHYTPYIAIGLSTLTILGAILLGFRGDESLVPIAIDFVRMQRESKFVSEFNA